VAATAPLNRKPVAGSCLRSGASVALDDVSCPRQIAGNLGPGLFPVRHSNEADLEPARQGDVVSAIRASARAGSPAGVFVLHDAINSAPEVARYCVGVTAEKSAGLAAMAVASKSTLTRVAATAFRMAREDTRSRAATTTAWGYNAHPDFCTWGAPWPRISDQGAP